MKNYHEEIARLNDVAGLIAIMDANIERNPDFYRKRMSLLDGFFSQQYSPVDIAIILYDALADAHTLAYHLDGNSLLFYRPKASHKRNIEAAFLVGDAHPTRTLLIWDGDMVTGAAMTESAEFFTQLGYDRSKTFGYLDFGCGWRQPNAPELMHIDDLLKK